MTDSLLISNSNQYAAYTAASKNEKSVSELSKLLRGEKVDSSKTSSEEPGMSMDKVIISKEALERLQAMNMADQQV
ncbi:MAG: hypothetical protein SPF17_03420 [Candidatus Mucispirillum faecigallinarum]|nr:hypothetical protein [Candidatus Mucispirillum faecigallinarum]